MNNGIEAFRSQLQKELGLAIGPKDPLLALWVSQKELLEQNAAQQQNLLSEFQAALGKSSGVLCNLRARDSLTENTRLPR